MSKALCIYHGNCDDGFAAAWCVRHALGDEVEFYPGVYQNPPPDVTDRDVLLVDFSYKRQVLLEMAKSARSIVILDHHHTAQEDLKGFREPAPFSEWRYLKKPLVAGDAEPIAALFDMNRSGAGLTWDFLCSPRPRPRFIEYIEDRDLWKKRLPESDEFTIALRSYPQDFDLWDKLVESVDDLIREGRTIQRYYRQRVEEIKRSAYLAELDLPDIFGDEICTCGIANAPYFAASEVAGELCDMQGATFGACFFEVSSGRWQYSLRSRNGFDVSRIALAFGGGGHKAAAGFTVDAPVHVRLQ